SHVTGVKYHRSKDSTYGNGNGLGAQPVSFKKEPVTEQAKQWQGFGTALKPAVELWLIARKPLSEKNIASNVLAWGTGALNISACKIETASLDDTDGRYPANLIHDGSKEVLDIFKKAGYRKSKKHDGDGALLDTKGTGWGFRRLPGGFSDEGTPERFFYCAKASTEERELGLNTKSAKAKNLKNNHPTVKPLSLIRYLVKLITPPNGIVLDPFAGSGTTGIACVLDGFKFICIEKEESYADIARERIDYFKHNNLFYQYF
ncbi:MAG: DNA methyltransferase, partial [Candidatus Micrarchaeaceae archaeon]